MLLCLFLVIAVLAALKFWQISKAIAFAESLPERSESVTAKRVQAESVPIVFRTVGEVRAKESVELRNEVAGVITKIGFSGGDRVEKEHTLVQLDTSEELAQLRATRAQLKLADLQLKRAQELKKKNLISKNDVDIARADKDVLLANEAALKSRIAKKTLVAPFAAETDVHNLQVGQFVAANTLLTELTGSSGQFWVDFDLPQEKASLGIGDQVVVSHPTLMAEPQQLEIVTAESRISSVTRSRGYRAKFEDSTRGIKPGALLSVEAILGEQSDIFLLPLTAVRKSNFGASVYVLEDAEPDAPAPFRAERRQVVVSPYDDRSIIVSEGLNAGELVALIGAFKLQDNLLVHVVERRRDQAAGYGDSSSPVSPADFSSQEQKQKVDIQNRPSNLDSLDAEDE